jgi:hypothetical protein
MNHRDSNKLMIVVGVEAWVGYGHRRSVEIRSDHRDLWGKGMTQLLSNLHQWNKNGEKDQDMRPKILLIQG